MLILKPDEDGLTCAARLLIAGRPVAFPTETVYGLGAIAFDEHSVAAIFEAKERPADNPLIVHVSSTNQVLDVASDFPALAQELAERFWPGPLTLVLPRGPRIPDIVSAGLPTVAVRQPAHPVALGLIRAVGQPLAAPSANRSGHPSPTCAGHVHADLEGRIEAVVDGGACTVGVESTVLDLSGEEPRLLRPGGVSREELGQVLGFLPAGADDDRAAASPGMRHRHYRPRCEVVIYEGAPPSVEASCGVLYLVLDDHVARNPPGDAVFRRQVSSLDDYARALFTVLRDADEAGVKRLYLPWPRPEGLGLALRDRIARAAGATMPPR